MVAVVPDCEQDVVETVKVARELDVPFAARSGHHAVTTTMRHLKNGVLIDMTRMKAMELNEGACMLGRCRSQQRERV